MAIAVKDRVQKYRKKKRDEGYRQITILLNKESAERFERLRRKMQVSRGDQPPLTNAKLTETALFWFERTVDKGLKRFLKEIVGKTAKEKGLSDQQIANCLNKKGIPALGDAVKWKRNTVADIFKK